MEKSVEKSQFAKNIKFLRESSKLSQEEFGLIFRRSRDNIMSYERGAEPKMEFLVAVSQEFKISIDDLIQCDLETHDSQARSTTAVKEYLNKMLNDKTEENIKLLKRIDDLESKLQDKEMDMKGLRKLVADLEKQLDNQSKSTKQPQPATA